MSEDRGMDYLFDSRRFFQRDAFPDSRRRGIYAIGVGLDEVFLYSNVELLLLAFGPPQIFSSYSPFRSH